MTDETRVVECPNPWRSPAEVPDVKRGDHDYFLVAVKWANGGQIGVFEACYLNAMYLIYDDDRCGDVEGDEDDEGTRRTTGWFQPKDHADYDTAYYPLLGDPGDELLGWMPKPAFQAPGSASNVARSVASSSSHPVGTQATPQGDQRGTTPSPTGIGNNTLPPILYLTPLGKPCEVCGEPVWAPTGQHEKPVMVMGERMWHGRCVPAGGTSGTFTLNDKPLDLALEPVVSRQEPLDSYHWHEALDRCYVFASAFEDHVGNHQVVERDHELTKLAEDAGLAMHRLYQAIGQKDHERRESDVTPKMKLPRYRHLKRGTEYNVEDRGTVQCEVPVKDGDELLAYRGDDGRLWFRPPAEFHDGRFERVDGQPKVGDPT